MKLGKHDHETDLRQDVTVRMRQYYVKRFSENVHCRCVSDVNLSASVAVKSVVRPVLGRVHARIGLDWSGWVTKFSVLGGSGPVSKMSNKYAICTH